MTPPSTRVSEALLDIMAPLMPADVLDRCPSRRRALASGTLDRNDAPCDHGD